MDKDFIERLSLTLPSAVVAGLTKEAAQRGRDLSEHIQKVLTRHVIGTGSIDEADANRLRLMYSLVERAVEAAKTICRTGGFTRDITHQAVNACLADSKWCADYEAFVQDNIYKSGNPLKGPINREIGFRIREGIGAQVETTGDKVIPVKVLGSIIQSYTPMASWDENAVATVNLEFAEDWLHRDAPKDKKSR